MRNDAPPADHIPVLYAQVMDGLRVVKDGTYLDGTFGRGGHARGVLAQLGPDGRLLLMDKDPQAIACAEAEFAGDPRVAIRRGSFAGLAEWEATAGGLDGVLLDLGVSSPQLDQAERGFSFMQDGPLDMRMDPDSGESAAEWLARATETEIADVLWAYGEERMSRRIARAIVARRRRGAADPHRRAGRPGARLHRSRRARQAPGHTYFQACGSSQPRAGRPRTGLAAALSRLKPGGRLAVISFHSLEDRQVKQFMPAWPSPRRQPGCRRRRRVQADAAPDRRRHPRRGRRTRAQSARPQRGAARGGEARMNLRVLIGLPLVLALVLSGIGVVQSRHEHRLLFAELTRWRRSATS
jgi:16S rRNA (cytosine1402-N4)-methyltransferase